MAFMLPELGFEYSALEPYIDAETMEIHHTRHHAGYLKKFNESIKAAGLDEKNPSAIFAEISKYDDSIRNYGGGFFNHSLFWSILTPHATEDIDDNFASAITKYFGNMDELKEEFSEAAATQFGSGWAWLVKKNNGELVITSSSNQDNPLMDISPVRGRPILCLDVWEHAYYLKYRNNRADYIQAFWNVVNWQKVNKLFNK